MSTEQSFKGEFINGHDFIPMVHLDSHEGKFVVNYDIISETNSYKRS